MHNFFSVGSRAFDLCHMYFGLLDAWRIDIFMAMCLILEFNFKGDNALMQLLAVMLSYGFFLTSINELLK